MVRNTQAKTTALILTIIVLVIAATQCVAEFPPHRLALCNGAQLIPRLTYHFLHANIFHAILNCWCLLSLVFFYDVNIWQIIAAYLIASSFPVDTLSEIMPNLGTPTVGMSAICYVLMDLVMPRVKRKLYYNAFVVFFVLMGLTFPSLCNLINREVAVPNNILHLYAYIMGMLVGFLNTPIISK